MPTGKDVAAGFVKRCVERGFTEEAAMELYSSVFERWLSTLPSEYRRPGASSEESFRLLAQSALQNARLPEGAAPGAQFQAIYDRFKHTFPSVSEDVLQRMAWRHMPWDSAPGVGSAAATAGQQAVSSAMPEPEGGSFGGIARKIPMKMTLPLQGVTLPAVAPSVPKAPVTPPKPVAAPAQPASTSPVGGITGGASPISGSMFGGTQTLGVNPQTPVVSDASSRATGQVSGVAGQAAQTVANPPQLPPAHLQYRRDPGYITPMAGYGARTLAEANQRRAAHKQRVAAYRAKYGGMTEGERRRRVAKARSAKRRFSREKRRGLASL